MSCDINGVLLDFLNQLFFIELVKFLGVVFLALVASFVQRVLIIHKLQLFNACFEIFEILVIDGAPGRSFKSSLLTK